MMTRRMATERAPEPPVRFYKIIAVSFLAVTVLLLGVVIFITSKKATIIVVSKQDTKHASWTVGVAPQGDGKATLSGVVTTTVFSWSNTYYPTGNKVVNGTAEGTVILYNKGSAAQPLVQKTQLLTPGGVLFRLKQGVVVPANGSITAPVYADQAGATGDIAPSTFVVVKLNPEKQRLVYAESKTAMTGGSRKVGVLSATEVADATEDYKAKVVAAYEAGLAANADTAGQAITLLDSSIKADQAVGTELSQFSLSGKNSLLLVRYDQAELNRLVADRLSQEFDAQSEKMLSLNKEPQVSVARPDPGSGKADMQVTQDVVVTLDANGEKLLPQHFVGQKKEEIQRYLLGLDHVSAVEVQFSPGWALSAPSVAEKIKVIVKNVN